MTWVRRVLCPSRHVFSRGAVTVECVRKSIATVSLSGSLEAKLAAIAAARFDGIELFDNDLVSSDLSLRQVAERCADLGLSIDLFQPIRDVEGHRPEDFPAVLRRVRKKFAIMEELGASVALACSSALPTALDDIDLTAEQLHALGDAATEHGFLLAFEALAWGRHINRFGQSWEAVRRADHPNVGVAVDTFHILSREDGPAELDAVSADKIAFLQIADAPRLDMGVLNWSRHFRCFPGQGNLDVAALVAKVLAAGYRGPLSLEVFSDVVRQAPARMTALDAMRSLLFLEEQLRAIRLDTVGAGRPQVDLFDPPPVPAHVDPGFVEFAVDEGDDSIGDLLWGLGWTHVADHRTRPVEWWRNGAANVCVTTTPIRTCDGSQPPSRPFASAIAVVTDEVRDVATRATALLWPRSRYRRGRLEAALPGMDTPNGLHVFLSSRPGQDDDWQQGFEALPDGPPDRQAGDWLGIDHIGATIPADAFPAEQSFYRTLFGLRPGDITEFISPSGRLRSRPLRPAAGSLRIILSVTDTAVGGASAGGVTQVAFRCADVAEVVRKGRAAGVRFLQVPDNYYEDLDARFELDPGHLARLKEHGLMYDRDARGQLTHVYTETINDSFYLEIVQRDGDYDDYGSPSTHVRLAAQHRARR